MAGVRFKVTTGEITIASAKTGIAIFPRAHQRCLVRAIKIYGKSVTSTDGPMLVEPKRIASGDVATGTGTSVTPTKVNDADDETLQTTAKKLYSAEPTYTGGAKDTYEIPAQVGGQLLAFGPGDEIPVVGGEGLGFLCTPSQSGVYTITLDCEE